MNHILEQIIIKKREDLKEKKKRISLEKLKARKGERGLSGVFYKAITKLINDPAVIAEVKFSSPSSKHLTCVPAERAGLKNDLLKRVKQYELSGADAISIITEPYFFKGSIDFIGQVKEVVRLPILQKDFVIDEYQIYEAKRAGSDALLLIARLVDSGTLERFVEFCFAEGIEPVVEVFSEEDLEKAIAIKTRFIAVNSRDLDTFEVDVAKACEIMKKISEKFIRLGFSGIKSAEEVEMYREAGARGVLVGTALMKTDDIGGFIDLIRK